MVVSVLNRKLDGFVVFVEQLKLWEKYTTVENCITLIIFKRHSMTMLPTLKIHLWISTSKNGKSAIIVKLNILAISTSAQTLEKAQNSTAMHQFKEF
jgi:nicotinic acid mononucleotide adenylyltransferase